MRTATMSRVVDKNESRRVCLSGRCNELSANGNCASPANRFTEASTGVVIPHLLQQNDVGIDRSENISRCRDPLCLYFRRRIMSRTVWEPLQIPSCDANL